MKLPPPRGPLTEYLSGLLHRGSNSVVPVSDVPMPEGDVLADEDLQLCLYLCYQLHFEGIEDVADDNEWDPDVLALRGVLEDRFELALRAEIPSFPQAAARDVPGLLTDLIAAQDGPSVSKFIRGRATLDQFREMLMHRSLYHLREADPHTFVIPRISGRPQAALVEIQLDEYGGGKTDRMHSTLFRHVMIHFGLDTTPGAYVRVVPAATLATNNLMFMFALHRRLRAALLGQLAVFEMNSSLPNRRYGDGMRRLNGGPTSATRYFDEHVEADAVHEQIAAHDLCAAFCAQEPDQTPTLLFGAAAWLLLETRLNQHLVRHWESGRTSLAGDPDT
jgi:hypothetical protein